MQREPIILQVYFNSRYTLYVFIVFKGKDIYSTNLKAVTEQEQRNRLCFTTKHITQFKAIHFSNAGTMRR